MQRLDDGGGGVDGDDDDDYDDDAVNAGDCVMEDGSSCDNDDGEVAQQPSSAAVGAAANGGTWSHRQQSSSLSSKRKRSRGEPSRQEDQQQQPPSSQPPSLEELVTPNFEELARHFPDFGRAWTDVQQRQKQKGAGGGGTSTTLSAQMTPEFSVALAKALLRVHFGVSLTHFSSDVRHLCPPIPNRYFFVQWLHRRVLPLSTAANFHRREDDSHRDSQSATATATTRLGVDIGTGASCIYPLLFAACSRLYSKSNNLVNNNTGDNLGYHYNMYATDVDPESVELARRNVQDNNLQSFIRVLLVQQPRSGIQQQHQPHQQSRLEPCMDHAGESDFIKFGPLRNSLDAILSFEASNVSNRRLDFCMTNPPFFDDDANSERTDRRTGDGRDRTPMTASEGSCPGGEVGFVVDVIADGLALFLSANDNTSKKHHDKSKAMVPVWSSCMCGKKTSLAYLKKILQAVLISPAHIVDTEFGPGHLTRWFLAFTFDRPRIRSELAPRMSWRFMVTDSDILAVATIEEAMEKATGRVVEYFRTFPSANCVCSVGGSSNNQFETVKNRSQPQGQQRWVEAREAEISILVDEDKDAGLPEHVRSLLSRISAAERIQYFLPPEGHFIVDAAICAVSTASGPGRAEIRVECYWHSEYGRKILEKMKSQMEGEICRTNRRWRRKLKREQQPQKMDESS